jgi:hypothetical protein
MSWELVPEAMSQGRHPSIEEQIIDDNGNVSITIRLGPHWNISLRFALNKHYSGLKTVPRFGHFGKIGLPYIK